VKPEAAPTLDQICTWCERFDNHPTEGWLGLVLDGTYSTAELSAAILTNRAPVAQGDVAAARKRLVDDVLRLPEYRGWSISQEEDHSRAMEDRLVWRHGDRDEKIWLDVVHKSRDQVALWINIDDPNDDPYHPRGGYEVLAEHTAAAVFAVCKPLIDECGGDDASDEAADQPGEPAAAAKGRRS